MKKFSGILLFLVLVLMTAIIPVAVILFNPDVAGPESCLNYTVASLINLALFAFIYWKAVPHWLARKRNRLFYPIVIALILTSGLLKTGLGFLFYQWTDQILTLSLDLPWSNRWLFSLAVSCGFTILAVVMRMTTDWHRNRQQILELEFANEQYARQLEDRQEKIPADTIPDVAIPSKPLSDILFIRSEYKIHRIRLSEILFVEGLKDYLVLWTVTEKILSLMSFKDLDPFMKPPEFIRIHKSYVVSLSKIDSVERSLVNIAGHQIPIGKSYRDAFFETLKQFQAGGIR